MMSFENKGSLASTVVVSLSPDLTGNYVCSGAADDVQINLALAEASRRGGGRVLLLGGDYVLAASIVFPGNELVLQGMGRATFIDGDALETTNHGIVISGRTDCTVRDLSIQTEDGGGKTCHCIFIEDGSDRFTVENVVIVESDAVGIRVEGTTIDTGHILHCEVLGADEIGIHVDMDGGNFMYRLHVKGCDIGNCGINGIYFTAGGENLYCEVINNIIYSCTQQGIWMFDSDYSMVRGNIIILNGRYGIVLNSTVHAQVLGNICFQNGRHGILFTDDDYCTVENNICIENDSGSTATYDGINLDSGSSNNNVNGNLCDGNDRNGIQSDGDNNSIQNNQLTRNGDYGIEITATADANKVKDNKFNGNTTGVFLDGGTNTELAVTAFQFTEAVNGAIVTASPTGVDVDATTEAALAWGQLPRELQLAVRLKIWAVATDAPIGTPGQMHLEVTFNAGASNAAYNEAGKSWNIVNFDGEETDYVANDVVHWVIEDGDVGTELSNLLAGDSFEIFAIWEVGDDPDGATDALFRVVEVEYV